MPKAQEPECWWHNILGVLTILLLAEQCQAETPEQPPLCDGIFYLHVQPSPWHYPEAMKCKTAPKDDVAPVEVNATIYKENFMEWQSEAVHCQKWVNKVSTIVSFFTDSKTRNTSTSPLRVSMEERRRMSRDRCCDAGIMMGHDGVYATRNNIKFTHNWCCRLSSNQLPSIKQHGIQAERGAHGIARG